MPNTIIVGINHEEMEIVAQVSVEAVNKETGETVEVTDEIRRRIFNELANFTGHEEEDGCIVYSDGGGLHDEEEISIESLVGQFGGESNARIEQMGEFIKIEIQQNCDEPAVIKALRELSMKKGHTFFINYPSSGISDDLKQFIMSTCIAENWCFDEYTD